MPAGTDEWVPVLSREDVVINSRGYPGEGARLDTVLVYKLVGVKAVWFSWPHLLKI